MSQGASPTSSPGAWDSVSYQYNDVLLNAPMSASALYFEVSRFDLGEAPLESDEEVFLALDNVTLTFCLPCDYDALVEPDAIIVGGPERIDIQLRRLNAYQFNASAPVCPNETLVFTVESGKSMKCIAQGLQGGREGGGEGRREGKRGRGKEGGWRRGKEGGWRRGKEGGKERERGRDV